MKHDSETTDKRTDRPKVSPYSKESKRDREEEEEEEGANSRGEKEDSN